MAALLKAMTADYARIFDQCPTLEMASSQKDLYDLVVQQMDEGFQEVSYPVPEKGEFVEATVAYARNGLVVNYTEPYMRRRDPESMLIADDLVSDKKHYSDQFDSEFEGLREQTLDWLAKQDLIAFAFSLGQLDKVGRGLAIAPRNAAFFAYGLGLLQGVTPVPDLGEECEPRTVIFVAPPFRHTHFDGRQMVVHARREAHHEIFSYNLYPGPSAKKGVYGSLLHIGSEEEWVVPHCSCVQVVTPYDNVVTIMHEGASGGGKSEMLEQAHRLPDGRIRKGRNFVTGEVRYLEIPRMCTLRPVADDMALCHPSFQEDDGKLRLADAENAWFVRVNHIDEYGTDHDLEKLTIHTPEPLLFLNVDTPPNGTALIWQHTQDAPGVPCPNPRVVIPRRIVPDVVSGPVAVDIRSFGVRTPPCTAEKPSYGIIGLFHLLPPALAWLWRLVAPRGHANPSIVDEEGMSSEGVGSYWPFATGTRVGHANLLLRQIQQTPETRYILMPNQYIGAWEVGFAPQWLARDYLARRGIATFTRDHVEPARCSLLGYGLKSMRIEGIAISEWFLRVERQPEVGEEAYDIGAGILRTFFEKHLPIYLTSELDDLGRRIIEKFMEGCSLEDYEELLRHGS